MDSTLVWLSTKDSPPLDGQTVNVKTKYGTVVHRATFFGHPSPRWEQPGMTRMVEYYPYWALISASDNTSVIPTA